MHLQAEYDRHRPRCHFRISFCLAFVFLFIFCFLLLHCSFFFLSRRHPPTTASPPHINVEIRFYLLCNTSIARIDGRLSQSISCLFVFCFFHRYFILCYSFASSGRPLGRFTSPRGPLFVYRLCLSLHHFPPRPLHLFFIAPRLRLRLIRQWCLILHHMHSTARLGVLLSYFFSSMSLFSLILRAHSISQYHFAIFPHTITDCHRAISDRTFSQIPLRVKTALPSAICWPCYMQSVYALCTSALHSINKKPRHYTGLSLFSLRC